MNSEIKLLHLIWKHGRESSARALANEANFGIDYTRYILNELSRKRLIGAVRNKRDRFFVIARGKKILLKMNYEGADAKPAREKRHRAVLPDSSYGGIRKRAIIRERPQKNIAKIILTHNLEDGDGEQKFKIGGVIERAARSLKGFLTYTEPRNWQE